jgi:hypothetical protein
MVPYDTCKEARRPAAVAVMPDALCKVMGWSWRTGYVQATCQSQRCHLKSICVALTVCHNSGAASLQHQAIRQLRRGSLVTFCAAAAVWRLDV